jgi:hypothetical protein
MSTPAPASEPSPKPPVGLAPPEVVTTRGGATRFPKWVLWIVVGLVASLLFGLMVWLTWYFLNPYGPTTVVMSVAAEAELIIAGAAVGAVYSSNQDSQQSREDSRLTRETLAGVIREQQVEHRMELAELRAAIVKDRELPRDEPPDDG